MSSTDVSDFSQGSGGSGISGSVFASNNSGSFSFDLSSQNNAGSSSNFQSDDFISAASDNQSSHFSTEQSHGLLSSIDSNDIHAQLKRNLLIAKFSPARRFLLTVVESRKFQNSILLVIFLNVLLMAFQTDTFLYERGGWYLSLIDNMFLGVYVFEMIIKMFVYRFLYFKSGWNIFDFIVVLTSFIDWIRFILISYSDFNPAIFRLLRVFRAVRALRALRALRAISFMKSLQLIVATLLRSLPGMSSIMLLLFLILYIFAVIGREQYGDALPDKFGGIGRAIFTLYGLITLDDWFSIYDAAKAQHPTMLIYLALFILLETFIFINLFVAVIVNNLQRIQRHNTNVDRREKRQERKEREEIQKEAQRLRLQTESELAEAAEAAAAADNTNLKKPNIQSKLLANYYLVSAAIENNLERISAQQELLDELVDTVDDQHVMDQKLAS